MRRSITRPPGPVAHVALVAAYVLLTSALASASLVLTLGEGSGASFLGHLAEWWMTALLPSVLFTVLMSATGIVAYRLARDGRTVVSVLGAAAGTYVTFGLAYVALTLAQDKTPGGDLGMTMAGIAALGLLAPAFVFAAVTPALAARVLQGARAAPPQGPLPGHDRAPRQ